MGRKKTKNVEIEEVKQVEEVKPVEQIEQAEEVKPVEEVEQVEEVKEIEPVKPAEEVDPKILILKEFAEFYSANLKGRSRISPAIGRQLTDIYNRYTKKIVKYTGCGTCAANHIHFLLNEYKKKITDKQ